MKRLFICITLFLFSTISQADLPLQSLKLPPGFSISVYAYPVPDAREMVLGDKGTLFVGTRSEGKVYAIIPNAQNPQQKQIIVIASGLDMPNGVAFRNGALYVAEIDRVIKFNDIEQHLLNPPKPVVVNDSFPDESHHGWKFIRFGPDGLLYIPVGAPCNVCISEDKPFRNYHAHESRWH